MTLIERAAKAAYESFWIGDGCKHTFELMQPEDQANWIRAVKAAMAVMQVEEEKPYDFNNRSDDRHDMEKWITHIVRERPPIVGVSSKMMRMLKTKMLEDYANLGEDLQGAKFKLPPGDIMCCHTTITVNDTTSQPDSPYFESAGIQRVAREEQDRKIAVASTQYADVSKEEFIGRLKDLEELRGVPLTVEVQPDVVVDGNPIRGVEGEQSATKIPGSWG